MRGANTLLRMRTRISQLGAAIQEADDEEDEDGVSKKKYNFKNMRIQSLRPRDKDCQSPLEKLHLPE